MLHTFITGAKAGTTECVILCSLDATYNEETSTCEVYCDAKLGE
jgi:hypothetical protein